MNFEQLSAEYKSRHPDGKLFATLPKPKGEYIVFRHFGKNGFLVENGAKQFLVDGYEVCDALPEVPGFYPQIVPYLFLRADTLERVKLAYPRG